MTDVEIKQLIAAEVTRQLRGIQNPDQPEWMVVTMTQDIAGIKKYMRGLRKTHAQQQSV